MMNDTEQGVWFVYDGDCELCTKAATALRIKEKYGLLNLLNARENLDHDLMHMIQARKLDLDEGMVIYHQGEFFHGVTALQFMAQFGDAKGWFNWINKSLFWSESLARVIYPWMRGVRNYLVGRKNVSRIDNLGRNNQPALKEVFDDHWDQLPDVLQRHYLPAAYSDEASTFIGTMDIKCGGPIKWFSPVLWLLRGIPPKTEAAVPVTVKFVSCEDQLALQFDRTFAFKHKKPYRFVSKLYPKGRGQVYEVMKFGITWKMNLHWDIDRIRMTHVGYALHWFGHFIPLPFNWLFGRGSAEEVAVDDKCFDMSVKITHPWWGEIYTYSGRFFVQE